MSKDDLVSRLRAWAELLDIPSGKFANEDIAFAADRITALEAEVGRWKDTAAAEATAMEDQKSMYHAAKAEAKALSAKLKLAEAALEPFADFGEYLEVETTGFSDDDSLCLFPDESFFERFRLKIQHFRRARSAYRSIRED